MSVEIFEIGFVLFRFDLNLFNFVCTNEKKRENKNRFKMYTNPFSRKEKKYQIVFFLMLKF